MITAESPILTLNNGVKMPALGLGVFQSSPEDTTGAVEAALRDGYRLIDTAAVYFNEQQVGEALAHSGIARSDIFVTTKVWISDYGYERTLHAFERSLGKLRLEYVDLYLLHWPVPSNFDATVASYRAAELLLADGRVRAIGVCNFTSKHLEALIARTSVVPAVNQVELNPFFTQRDTRDADTHQGIITQSWSPIGGVIRYSAKDPMRVRDPLKHPVIVAIAEKYSKTPAQVTLRWHIEHGLSAIPKSVHAKRIAENYEIFDFSLSSDEVAAIDGLDTGVRAGLDPEKVDTHLLRVRIGE